MSNSQAISEINFPHHTVKIKNKLNDTLEHLRFDVIKVEAPKESFV